MKEETKYRISKSLEFLENEIGDFHIYKDLSWTEYDNDRRKRRKVERWIENILNCTIDLSKIILNFSGYEIPETYQDSVKKLTNIKYFNSDTIAQISEQVKIRNILTHSYLDIKWVKIKKFIQDIQPHYVNYKNLFIK